MYDTILNDVWYCMILYDVDELSLFGQNNSALFHQNVSSTREYRNILCFYHANQFKMRLGFLEYYLSYYVL